MTPKHLFTNHNERESVERNVQARRGMLPTLEIDTFIFGGTPPVYIECKNDRSYTLANKQNWPTLPILEQEGKDWKKDSSPKGGKLSLTPAPYRHYLIGSFLWPISKGLFKFCFQDFLSSTRFATLKRLFFFYVAWQPCDKPCVKSHNSENKTYGKDYQYLLEQKRKRWCITINITIGNKYEVAAFMNHNLSV